MTRTPPPDRADPPLAVLTRPWFWIALMATLFSFPLIKGLGAEFPEPLPGMHDEPLEFSLPDVDGRQVALSDLHGDLKLVSELPFANRTEALGTFERMNALRKRLRGLGSAVVYVTLCHGGTADELADLLEASAIRKPVNAFLLDEERTTLAWLRREAGSETADVFLIDRHGRVRGTYGRRPGEALMSDDEVDRLVADTGQLANWVGSDLPPGSVPQDG